MMTMATEETLVLVKPDGVARGLTGAILARIEAKGYALVDIRLVEPDRARLERHYEEHAGKPFYEPLVEFVMRAVGRDPPRRQPRHRGVPLARGHDRPHRPRRPARSAATTGRDWGLKVQQNLVHGSDSSESAARELDIWFG